MDYNYVRMRNAVKDKDYEKAEHYRNLYELGKMKVKAMSPLNIVIAILLSVALLLGVYILYSETKQVELYPTLPDTTQEPLPVIGGSVIW